MAFSESLKGTLKNISENCIQCSNCVEECGFLKHYGFPKDLADSFRSKTPDSRTVSFQCSLCRLCAAVCPENLDPSGMFLEMRRDAVRHGYGDFPEHGRLLGYEKTGTSKRYSWYGFPDGCDTVLFPGCTLAGTRSDKVMALYQAMKQGIPSLGIVLDCCTNPSHDLGREDFFNAMFGEMKSYLIDNGIRKVYVACPNCYKVFKQYGDEFTVETVYEYLAETGRQAGPVRTGPVTIHDPCATRFEDSIHSAVRKLFENQDVSLQERLHNRRNSICCGEGGGVGSIASHFAEKWTERIRQENDCQYTITYCAGCNNSLGKTVSCGHLLDHFFEPENTAAGKAVVTRSPFTYWKRLKLKRKLRHDPAFTTSRERTFQYSKESSKTGLLKKILPLLAIVAAILAMRWTGLSRYMETEALRQLVEQSGIFAPLVYMLIYTIAPVLFFPGLPITIVGGILFGPFWGVLYAIIGSTCGACAAFLVSRHISGNWIETKLKSPRWRRLYDGVEKHGWKMVAFTRLVPIFPFNLLNYAFGLTKIKFWHYAVTTFVCMLPACIAFIVFSSSLLDIFRGKVSASFLVGIGLIVLISLIPVLYRRYKKKWSVSDSL